VSAQVNNSAFVVRLVETKTQKSALRWTRLFSERREIIQPAKVMADNSQRTKGPFTPKAPMAGLMDGQTVRPDINRREDKEKTSNLRTVYKTAKRAAAQSQIFRSQSAHFKVQSGLFKSSGGTSHYASGNNRWSVSKGWRAPSGDLFGLQSSIPSADNSSPDDRRNASGFSGASGGSSFSGGAKPAATGTPQSGRESVTKKVDVSVDRITEEHYRLQNSHNGGEQPTSTSSSAKEPRRRKSAGDVLQETQRSMSSMQKSGGVATMAHRRKSRVSSMTNSSHVDGVTETPPAVRVVDGDAEGGGGRISFRVGENDPAREGSSQLNVAPPSGLQRRVFAVTESRWSPSCNSPPQEEFLSLTSILRLNRLNPHPFLVTVFNSTTLDVLKGINVSSTFFALCANMKTRFTGFSEPCSGYLHISGKKYSCSHVRSHFCACY